MTMMTNKTQNNEGRFALVFLSKWIGLHLECSWGHNYWSNLNDDLASWTENKSSKSNTVSEGDSGYWGH